MLIGSLTKLLLFLTLPKWLTVTGVAGFLACTTLELSYVANNANNALILPYSDTDWVVEAVLGP